MSGETMQDDVLRAQGVTKYFPVRSGFFFRREKAQVKAVDGVDLYLRPKETLGLVGESGCGKSTLGRTLIRLYDPDRGSILVDGKDISTLRGSELRQARLSFQMIFQDPYASLDPRMSVFDIVAEPLRSFKICTSRADLERRVSTLMEQVGLSKRYIRKYPHEFSGGQRQRIAIARALAIHPKVVICDEPVSALDVSIQAQILNLLRHLQDELGLSYLFIAHDLSAVRYISDRIAVMYLGKIVETARTEDLFTSPRHPYTKALLSAVPMADPRAERQRQMILLSGELPSPSQPPKGCAFHTRCPWATADCALHPPKFHTLENEHTVSCSRLAEIR